MSALATARVRELPDGARGFDLNRPLTLRTAPLWKARGYAFVGRYVWRVSPHPEDLTPAEVEVILASGLGLDVTQHYEGDGWTPSEAKGVAYGGAAVNACRSLLLPMGQTVWLDLEGVSPGVSVGTVDAYARAWCDVVLQAGYLAGVYFGWHCVLNADQLYRLPAERYRSAYNANADQYPAVRGVCMRQRIAMAADVPDGVGVQPYEIDLDIVQADKLGGLPTALLPGDGVLA